MTADPVRPQETLRDKLRDALLGRLCPTMCGYRINSGGQNLDGNGKVYSWYRQGGPCGVHVTLAASLAAAVLPIVEEETARQLAVLRDKVKALADGWDATATDVFKLGDDAIAVTYEDLAGKLHAFVEEPQGNDPSLYPLIVTDPDADHSRAYDTAVAQIEGQRKAARQPQGGEQ